MPNCNCAGHQARRLEKKIKKLQHYSKKLTYKKLMNDEEIVEALREWVYIQAGDAERTQPFDVAYCQVLDLMPHAPMNSIIAKFIEEGKLP